jgi:hypothetical protein
MVDQLGDGYTGPFYLELQTETILHDPNVASTLDELSAGIILNLERPGVTIWEFLDQGSAFKGVLILEQKELPFSLTGKNDLVFIVKPE